MKNGAELLDRLIKDIVAESAATYVSVLQAPEETVVDPSSAANSPEPSLDMPTAFSLARFIPLLKERIYVINPFTRTFLVSWVTLLDTIPDLELVFYLPAFLGGLFQFLSDPNRDVYVATQGALERFLTEIKKIARIKRGIAESRKSQRDSRAKDSSSSDSASTHTGHSTINERQEGLGPEEGSVASNESSALNSDGDWIPGQDVQVDHPAILEILVDFLDSSSGLTPLLIVSRLWLKCTYRGGDPAHCSPMDRQLFRNLSRGHLAIPASSTSASPACDGEPSAAGSTGGKSSQHVFDGLHCLSV